MKHKYELILENEALTLREFGELDKEMFTLLCRESYDLEKIQASLDAGLDAVVSSLRSPNFYPTRYSAEKLAVAVAELCRSKDSTRMEVVLDDAEILSDDFEPSDMLEEFEEANDGDGNELEELLSDDGKLDRTKGSFRIADSEDLDDDDA